MFIVYSADGEGSFQEVSRHDTLETAKADCPPSSRIEQTTDTGSVVVYTA